MMPAHEWLPPPPLKSIRELTETAVDWHAPRRFESYSDGEDDLPHSREPIESACQSSGYDEGKGVQSSGYGDNKVFQSFGYTNCNDLQSSTTKIISSNKEVKVKLSANRRVDHTDIAPRQNSTPLWLNPCPLSVPLRRIHPNQPMHVTDKKKSVSDPREPSSPEVTCLGRVRIKENHSHNTDHSIAANDHEGRTCEGKKQPIKRNHMSDEMKQSSKQRSRNQTAEKGGCLARRKQRQAASAITQSDATETRRERAAALARSLTSLLEDLRKLEMEKEGYEPAVPPPNSLLLMRGGGSMDMSRFQEFTMMCDEDDFRAEVNNNGSDCENTYAKDLCLPGMKKMMERCALAEHANMNAHASAQQVLPLSEIKSNFLAQNTLSAPKSELPVDHRKDCSLALWQRRAFAKIDAIDTKMRTKVAGERPATK